MTGASVDRQAAKPRWRAAGAASVPEADPFGKQTKRAGGQDRLAPLWRPKAILAVMLCGQGLAGIVALSPGASGDTLLHFAVASMAIQWVALLTLCGLYLLRRPLAWRPPSHTATAFLGLLVLNTLAVGAMLQALPGVIEAPVDAGYWARLVLVSMTIGLFSLAAVQNTIAAKEAAIEARTARLSALQARIRPHFLFNTLNTGAALVHDKPEAAEDLLLDLADLFRAALTGPELIDLAEELELARRYLHIEQLRFGDRLRVRWEVPDELPDVKVPALSLQPLVENAVRHGVEPCQEGGELLLQVAVGRRTVQVLVQNPVARDASGRHNGHSIGLASVRARIEALSEGRSRLEVLPGEGVYRVAIVVPLE